MKRRNFIKQSAFAGASLAALGGLSSCRLNELGVVKLTILHTNDVHSRIDPFPTTDSKYPGLGGFARRAEMVNLLQNRTFKKRQNCPQGSEITLYKPGQ